ncbi:type II toxin-antitoxin system VapB family antitoxin [bacterium]|nr:type II toxin-antitoxin system VapB family antitoxin [Akkermansiaceae bacterium]MDB4418799.1 type II toxin-antitoxin system VapB family antitoxin [bacterium]MDB4295524.1 type II toxin-antitoxin system VapB family antitoxin [Akkermansiaceae bacterium]MDB4373687.1 type II toxin-antitoxin system VapB family antitoxin [Akkermansiaceae bacterium]MDB4456617.1 type II toxin-antitoxin system VapB family antitoxin [bacterium]
MKNTLMRITIEIDDKVMKEAMLVTGEKKKGPAISKAASEYVRRQMIRRFANKVMEGGFEDYPMTNDELEAVDR